MPKFDVGSCFGKLLDIEKGGSCFIASKAEPISRRYIDNSLVLETSFRCKTGLFNVVDFLVVCEGGATSPKQQLVRIVTCTSGHVELELVIQPRFDYGLLLPWIRQEELDCFSAIGGNDALIVNCDQPLISTDDVDIRSKFVIHAGQKAHLSIKYVEPAEVKRKNFERIAHHELDQLLDQTVQWWNDWAKNLTYIGMGKGDVLRSALVLKGLCYAPTGAIIAAPTTSLPEHIGGDRNWDYRFSWIRDSVFSTRALSEIGFLKEASRFREFVQRSSASNADSLLIMYGIDGRRRLDEIELSELMGYMNSRPVRYGNAAFKQKQFDCYGLLLQLVWHWHQRGQSPDDDLWKFIIRVVDFVCERWAEPDQGLWESRGGAKHFVHSKIMLWCAIDRGIKLSNECLRKAPLTKWRRVRAEIESEILNRGIDKKQQNFVREFGSKHLDSALLLIPQTGFVDWQDERMVATCDAVIKKLDRGGLIARYEIESADDGLVGEEGSFIACTFWLVECLAMQGRLQEAHAYYDRAMTCANDLGLMSEEYDVKNQRSLGNFPQGLSHLSQIAAATALNKTLN